MEKTYSGFNFQIQMSVQIEYWNAVLYTFILQNISTRC